MLEIIDDEDIVQLLVIDVWYGTTLCWLKKSLKSRIWM